MVEQVFIMCKAYFYTFLLDFFFKLSWIGKLLPGESWLFLTKGNVWSIRSTDDQPVFWNSSKVHLMNHQLASIQYIVRAQHNVMMSNNGRTRDWTGWTAREKRKSSEAAWRRSWEAKQRKRQKTSDIWCTFLIRATLVDHVLSHGLTMAEAGWRVQPNVGSYAVLSFSFLYCNDMVYL